MTSSRIAFLPTLALLAACTSQPNAAESSDHHGGHHGKTPIGHVFKDPEKWSKRFDDPKRREWQRPEHVIALMKIEPGMTVADIGAGTGYFLSLLSSAVGSEGAVLALDIEASFIEYMEQRVAREKLENVKAKKVEVDDPSLEPGSVDRILIVNTWHHIPERAAYTKKIVEGLSAGGEIYIVDYTKDSPIGPPKEIRLPPEKVVEELSGGGLSAEAVEETLPRQYIVVGRKK